MVEIMTIGDFMQLSKVQQEELLKALRVRDRLDKWMDTVLNQKRPTVIQSEWRKCKHCDPEHPGWYLESPRNDSDIHPSQVNKCLKKLWYDCAGYAPYWEEHIEPRLHRTFHLGHAWHHTIQGYGKAGAWCDKKDYHEEVTIDPDAVGVDERPILPIANHLWIRGSADAVIDRYICRDVPGLGDVVVRMVHEYKTINSNGFQNLKKPKPEHKWQAMIYAGVFDIPLVVFLYLNKDTSAQIDYPVPFDTILWKQIEQKLLTVKYYVENDALPPWELTSAVKDPYECKSCGYANICQPNRR